MQGRGRHAAAHAVLLVIAAFGLLGVFLLYTDPDFLVTLSNQVWTCT
jgi:hypothetical protein